MTKNGIYTFKVYDYNDNGKGGFNETIKEIEVTNIDNVAPMGVCTALVRGNNTEIEVLASDNKGIAGYSYNLDGIESGYKNESTYKVASASKVISVNIKDIAGNVYTENVEGINVHRYGAHIFHTDYKDVWDLVSELKKKKCQELSQGTFYGL